MVDRFRKWFRPLLTLTLHLTRSQIVTLMNNSKAEALAARLVDPVSLPRRENDMDSDVDDDEAIFAELEAEIENSDAYTRETAMAAIKREMEKVGELKKSEHGTYTEVMDEQEVIRITAREPVCVVHFYHTNFKRCEIMDQHLAKLAPKYFNTRFFRVFVENIPWLVEKLSIKVLPCVICFVDGVTKDKLVGFEELGNNDAFSTATLELRLSQSNVLQKHKAASLAPVYHVKASNPDDDEIFDLDD